MKKSTVTANIKHTSIPGGGGMAIDGGGPLSCGGSWGGGAIFGAFIPLIGGPVTSIPGGITPGAAVGTDMGGGRTVGAVPGGGADIL